jgi:peptide deformylase
MVREILLYPDPRLKQTCDPIVAFDDGLRALVADLRETLAASPGVGLAAPQIGVMRRVVLIDVSAKFPERRPLVLVNPEILELHDKKIIREGCLSIPEFTANVLRAERIRFRAFDEHGRLYEMESEALEAIAVQHENDHLDGILFLDRVASLKTDVFRRKGGRREVKLPSEASMAGERSP